MKITDYPSVSSLTDGDVILIDGNNGTKKLPAGGNIYKMTSSFNSSDNASETGIIVASGETAMSKMTSGDTHGGLFGGLSKAVLNTRKLINTVKRIWQTVANAWVSGASYSVGQVVTYTNGHTYVCREAHTSSASITPLDTTYWNDKTIGDMIYSLNSKCANIGVLYTKTGSTTMRASYTRYELCSVSSLPVGTYIICAHWKYDSTSANNFLGDVMDGNGYIDALAVASEEGVASAWGKQLSASTIVRVATTAQSNISLGGRVNYNTGMTVTGILKIARLK